MRLALSLGARGLGNTWPNPAVGAVLVKDGRIVGRGWTADGGRPHAETTAIKNAGPDAKGATAYVSLEPCSHQGETPPCAEALADAGVTRVVVAIEDADPRVSGSGITYLNNRGIEVEHGLCEETARDANQGFFTRVALGRPAFTMKMAATLDGRIATQTGDSQWITGIQARAMAHQLRARHDAVMIGSGTLAADNPTLTARLGGIGNARRPRIVLDSRLRIGLDSNLVKSIVDAPLWVVTKAGAHGEGQLAPLRSAGAEVIEIAAGADDQIDLTALAAHLGGLGLTNVLVEGGGALAASMLRADLVDRVAWFRAPAILGGDAMPAIGALGIQGISEMFEFSRKSSMSAGPDGLDILTRKI
ncbi:MAG: bifunctional diaminohydroxyphosphoribosylaminopyrimidine deaminase/5-amino-6-(5-phosphoribosylamino)uracil reductase RibD [Rhodospirillaceae bacterium]|jgi:diaminohydroxyphosphoribosylaminopyrimidine deaminase/5-amino-6-(5-phosphoribosylamino)uracil reductase|nr:bifunctional diaminohydroxyphosphoribosylaminopyrimidine deaminase/5-amino-6-(5-phosphoribosylamino)uracil reductase RibD [Rhodospirillaceae bacterium]MBT3886746.1 bifunctional diaminohydroxyphosphoribosylaminopyrimidine deaminase/5-amino-6-(5-phosphoribosylamino)uracil reductase RibD [Rhodospirillaceae bacterium]MBT4115101.1 bifunctional diaminohydroxyphosphoribosylaminopyrimidine deaminase/5-amino-6-(5-phosphoribosylamino)uracil reductase RibD [Rhodospirillaceae bacterium]MBT4674323.1 bifun